MTSSSVVTASTFFLFISNFLTLSSAVPLLEEPWVVNDVQPQQVHLSFGDKASDLVVTWSTMNHTDRTSQVHYGVDESELLLVATGSAFPFVDGGRARRTQQIHRVKLAGLQPGREYCKLAIDSTFSIRKPDLLRYISMEDYRCGSDAGWSAVFRFTAAKDSADWSPRIAIYGDMGTENPQSLPRLQAEAQEKRLDAVYHIGDFGYDLYEEDGLLGDRFMRQIEPIAAYVPYMTAVGNHEEAYNFSHYVNRFTMPGGNDGLMYSWNLGAAHIVTISTEFYYFLNYGFKQVYNQFEWLVRDLARANLPENRSVRPWIIIAGHRPMYCSNEDEDCNANELTRTGLTNLHWFGLEKLLFEYGVDLALWAHEHSYERLWPVYNYTVMNGSDSHPYTDPRATVHVTTGSAGCREERDPFVPSRPYWSAFRSNDYGYTRLLVANGTHLYLEQVSDDQGGKVIDNFWIIKSQPRGFLHTVGSF